MMPPVGAVALLIATTIVAAPQDRYTRPDPFDASVRTVREAVRLPPGGARSPALLALIDLEDPELQPLFQALVQRQDRPVMQADAIVGIARADPRRSIDPFIVRQVSDLGLRSEVIKSLIGRGLLKPKEINQILRWPEAEQLLPEDRLFLVATLARDSAEWDVSDIEPVANTETPELRALYSLLLLEKGETARWEEFRSKIAEMTPSERSSLLGALAPAVRAYRLKSSVAPLLRLAADRDVDANIRAAIIGSALELDSDVGLAAMKQELALDRDQRNMLRYSLLLLVVSETKGIGPEAFDLFKDSGSREIDVLIAAGRCAHSGEGCAEALTRVIDLGLRPAAEWALARASALAKTDPALARTVMTHTLDLAAQARDPREPIVMLGVKAAVELIALDPDELRRRLQDTATPPAVQEAIALAMVAAASERAMPTSIASDSSSPGQAAAEDSMTARRMAAADFASSTRGNLPRRFDSMALVAIARGRGSLSAAEIEQLGVIGAGGGRVDEAIRVQAAWLHLKALGRHREALGRIAPE